MTMSFHTLKCPSQFTGSIYTHRTQSKIKCNPTLALNPSSILLQTDESENLPESKKKSSSGSTPTNSRKSSPLLSQINTVGIIGGVSAASTLNFTEKLVKWSSKDQEENLPFVVCSDPVLKKELSSCGSSFHLNTKNVCLNLDSTPILENLRSKRNFLEQSGARCIVMPCHISHIWHGEISKGCSVPFPHVGDCVAKELKRANLKPLEAGSNLRIGVLATDATLTAGFYQEKLQNQGFEVVLPDKATMEHTVIPAIEALNRKDMEGARNLLRIAVQVLLVRAVNIVILASDDMRDLLPPGDPLLKKCIDPMDALARSTLKWARSTQQAQKTLKT
ncbi:Asp/Glu/hydantoin racemase [Macleaya cordata]|uniref:Asp/Glu/hydantoin racemase n=1 Tax=Macleaya cordata TaxID=56857 RepID=A0A200PQI9_MACCD|nr:Asp/Glu/hydantoin racemase [Macleaya cordata]